MENRIKQAVLASLMLVSCAAFAGDFDHGVDLGEVLTPVFDKVVTPAHPVEIAAKNFLAKLDGMEASARAFGTKLAGHVRNGGKYVLDRGGQLVETARPAVAEARAKFAKGCAVAAGVAATKAGKAAQCANAWLARQEDAFRAATEGYVATAQEYMTSLKEAHDRLATQYPHLVKYSKYAALAGLTAYVINKAWNKYQSIAQHDIAIGRLGQRAYANECDIWNAKRDLRDAERDIRVLTGDVQIANMNISDLAARDAFTESQIQQVNGKVDALTARYDADHDDCYSDCEECANMQALEAETLQ